MAYPPVNFGGTELPNASKHKGTIQVLTNDTILIDGKHSIQSSTEVGTAATYTCLGTWAQYEAVLACIGSSATLDTQDESYTNMYISSWDGPTESANPGYYFFTVGFVKETAV